jgi:hypothetical protein
MKTRTMLSRGGASGGLILTMAAGIAVSIALTTPRDVGAQGDESGRACSNGTLRGDYGLSASGIRAVPPLLGGGTEHFVATAMWSFQGDGRFTQGPGGGLHGQVTGSQPDPIEIPGTYEVNSNCTGRMQLHVAELPFPIEYTFVIVDNAREVKAGVMSGQLNATTVLLTRK